MLASGWFSASAANRQKREQGILITNVDAERQQLKQQMMKTKNTRFIDVPKNYYDDIDATVSVITTNETYVKSAILQTLSNMLQTVAQNPQILQDPTTKKIFNKIMEVSGAFSPVELQTEPAMAQPQPQQPGQQPGQPQAPLNPLSALMPQQVLTTHSV